MTQRINVNQLADKLLPRSQRNGANEMEPKKVGRVLGAGVRVASNMARQRMAQAAAPGPQVPVAAASRKTGGDPGVRAQAAKRGIKAFGQGILGPFRHAGGVLWLEMTGLFFALFALFFVENVYRARGSWRQGADHIHWMLYVLLAAAFAWFSFSSFQRAYRKNRRGRRNG